MNAAYAEPSTVAKWLSSRQLGIGSSDAAAICGCNPWKTPLEVYLDKIENKPPTGELPDNPAIRAGLILEPAVARYYEIETGRPLTAAKAMTHPTFSWMQATPDRFCFEIGIGNFIVELKTASAFSQGWGEPGTDEVPEMYMIQVQHQMAVCEMERADVAVLIAGADFRVYNIKRNDAVIQSLIDIESEFMDRVANRNAPEPDWNHESTPGLMNRLYRPREGVEIDSPELLAKVSDYKILKADISDAERKVDTLKAEIIAAMGEASIARVGDYTIRRKQTTRKAYEVAESTYTSFAITSKKGSK